MGLFDELAQAAGMGGQNPQAQDQQAQGDDAGAGAPGGAVGAVISMLQSHPGGIGGVMQQFESSGLSGVAQSWLGGGQNQAVSPDQVQSALGPGAIGQVASMLGVSQDQAASHVSQFLPMIMDHLSPGGQAPAGGGFGELEGLMSRFTGGQPTG